MNANHGLDLVAPVTSFAAIQEDRSDPHALTID